LPAAPLERDHIPLQRIITHLSKSSPDKCLLILRELPKLSCGVS
jgi:hypothetical protein